MGGTGWSESDVNAAGGSCTVWHWREDTLKKQSLISKLTYSPIQIPIIHLQKHMFNDIFQHVYYQVKAWIHALSLSSSKLHFSAKGILSRCEVYWRLYDKFTQQAWSNNTQGPKAQSSLPAPSKLGKIVWRNILKELLSFGYSDEIVVIIHRCTDLLCRFTMSVYAWRLGPRDLGELCPWCWLRIGQIDVQGINFQIQPRYSGQNSW